MSVPVVLCLCACLVLVPSQAAPVADFSTQPRQLEEAQTLPHCKSYPDNHEQTALLTEKNTISRISVRSGINKDLSGLNCNNLNTTLFLCDEVCPSGWSRREGSCYKFTQCTHDMSCSANHALTLCRKQGAELAAIESLQENDFVASLVDKSIIANVFIGGRDQVVEERWQWPDGSIAKFTNWHRNQPDNCCGGQDCMVIWPGSGNKWDDAICSNRYSARDTGYVCEKGITN